MEKKPGEKPYSLKESTSQVQNLEEIGSKYSSSQSAAGPIAVCYSSGKLIKVWGKCLGKILCKLIK